MGIDIKDTCTYLLEKYPERKWLNGEEVDFATHEADLVISSDVIEHFVIPNDYLDNLKKDQGSEVVCDKHS